jgi:hypothetical protein
LAARGQLPFRFTKKVTQKGDTNIRPFPAVLARGGTKTNRPMARYRARWAHGFGLGPPVAPLLGVEYTGTPFERKLDRFAMEFCEKRIERRGRAEINMRASCSIGHEQL